MNVIEAGHIYELNTLDGDGKPQRLVFVNREKGTEHPGTQTQEVLRMTVDILSCLIDRTNHCDNCLRWEGNDRIIKAMSEAQRQMRLALLFHEQRALERKMEKDGMLPDKLPTGEDGHIVVQTQPTPKDTFDNMWGPLRERSAERKAKKAADISLKASQETRDS
jgi:hypothetical protein